VVGERAEKLRARAEFIQEFLHRVVALDRLVALLPATFHAPLLGLDAVVSSSCSCCSSRLAAWPIWADTASLTVFEDQLAQVRHPAVVEQMLERRALAAVALAFRRDRVGRGDAEAVGGAVEWGFAATLDREFVHLLRREDDLLGGIS